MITPEKCKAARALLGWSQANLATEASIGITTIKSYEAGNNDSVRNSTITLIVMAFEKVGIEFLEGGVILNKKS